MADPTNISGINAVIAEFQKSVGQHFNHVAQRIEELGKRVDIRFAGVNTKIYFVVALLLALLGSVGLMYKELGVVQSDVSAVKTHVIYFKDSIEKLTKLDLSRIDESAKKLDGAISKLDRLGNIENAQSQIQSTLGNILKRLPSSGPSPDRRELVPIELNAGEAGAIREFFRLKKGEARLTLKFGDQAPDLAVLSPTPKDLQTKIPRLAGTRFFIDVSSGTVVFVSSNDNKILALVRG